MATKKRIIYAFEWVSNTGIERVTLCWTARPVRFNTFLKQYASNFKCKGTLESVKVIGIYHIYDTFPELTMSGKLIYPETK